MRGRRLRTVGLSGLGLAILCCVTPVLPFVLTGIGLGGVVGYVYTDRVLYPLIALFLVIAGVGLWQMKRSSRYPS